MMEPMRSRPATRKKFEHNLYLYAEAMKQGKIHFAQGISLEGFDRARKVPNGRIDLTSIDEMTRLHANTIASMHAQGFNPPSENEEPPERFSSE